MDTNLLEERKLKEIEHSKKRREILQGLSGLLTRTRRNRSMTLKSS